MSKVVELKIIGKDVCSDDHDRWPSMRYDDVCECGTSGGTNSRKSLG